MFTRGEFSYKENTYGVIMDYNKGNTTIALLLPGSGNSVEGGGASGWSIVSAYKNVDGEQYSFNTSKAREMYDIIAKGVSGCKSKNGIAYPCELGALTAHEFKKSEVEYTMYMCSGMVYGANIVGSKYRIRLDYMKNPVKFPEIQYIKLTSNTKPRTEEFELSGIIEDDVVVRSVEEIALEKDDITWLKSKKYYIINDEAQAEQIFSFLDNYNGLIGYDTETTGLKMNCFCKINSEYKSELEKWNDEHPNDQIRADKLVGIIYCVEKDVSYYFPVGNRKFKNLYEDVDNPYRKKIIERTKALYTVGELRDMQSDMADYVRNTPGEEWTPDIVLMMRNKNILEKKNIDTHGGKFEWKVGWVYEIDTNIVDDSMILHQIMYKFRGTTRNSGEPSGLKYLSKVELGIDQWELEDFFPDYKEDSGDAFRHREGGKKKRKKVNSRIDFSYMTYDGTRIYAPCDGDATLQLTLKYKKDLMENHREMEYLYKVEVIVSMAVAYMEFYGHRIDEHKISFARDTTYAKLYLKESEFRQEIGYSGEEELRIYDELRDMVAKLEDSKEQTDKNIQDLNSLAKSLKEAIVNDEEHVINLGSPKQMADLFFDTLEIPLKDDKKSVSKKVLKGYLKLKDDNGNPKYPAVNLYSEYKSLDTLITKFFDNLPYFMYPGGYIFSSYGQIDAATGRMNCKKPNAQQYPKSITKIVVPRPGYVMIDADYSQIEYRVLVGLSGCQRLWDMFKDPDSDYHTLMASLMFGVPYEAVSPDMRKQAKSFNFGIPYGMGFKSLAILLHGNSSNDSVADAKEKYEMYFKDQPETRKFFDDAKEKALVNGYTKTYWNRYRYYSFTDAEGNIDNSRKAASLRQAGNALIQGTAADMFKIGVARNFSYIRRNHLFGDFLITNMIHDEQLTEVNAQKLNVERVLCDLGQNMSFAVDDFPPLFVGAGVGLSWGVAKDKDAEIHPNLLKQLTEESLSMPIRRTEDTYVEPNDIVKYFSDRIYQFCKDKVISYAMNPDNYGKGLHPEIASLLNSKFKFDFTPEELEYFNSKDLSEDEKSKRESELTLLKLKKLVEANGKYVDTNNFKGSNSFLDEEVDSDYDDGEEQDDLLDGDIDYNESEYLLVDESGKVFGCRVQDILEQFKVCLLEESHICGIDLTSMARDRYERIIDYLSEHVCEEGGYEVVFMKPGRFLTRTSIYVDNVDISVLDNMANSVNFRKIS